MVKYKLKDIPIENRYKFFNSDDIIPLKEVIYKKFGSMALVDEAMTIIFEDEKIKVDYLIIKYPNYFEIVDD